jgi:tripartite-type tricarboxylate transporter receptor subunit TctC
MFMHLRRLVAVSAFAAIAGGAFSAVPAYAGDVADFFNGKQLQFVVGAGTGGGYDLYMRTLSLHMGNKIPGQPSIVLVNMSGAGGVKAFNYVYNAAPRDGTVLLMPFFNNPLFQLIRPEGIRFDAREMRWIGNMAELNSVIAVRSDLPVKTIEDAMKQEVILGASARGSETYFYPQLANALLQTKFKMVMGYQGTAAMTMAMETGELHGRGGSWQIWPVSQPEWVREGRIRVLLQFGLRRDPDLPDVPLITELVSDADKPVARFVSSAVVMARMVGAPPAVPDERVEALRTAFDATMKDEAFLADARKRQMDLRVMSGQEVEAAMDELFRTPSEIVERTRAILDY